MELKSIAMYCHVLPILRKLSANIAQPGDAPSEAPHVSERTETNRIPKRRGKSRLPRAGPPGQTCKERAKKVPKNVQKLTEGDSREVVFHTCVLQASRTGIRIYV